MLSLEVAVEVLTQRSPYRGGRVSLLYLHCLVRWTISIQPEEKEGRGTTILKVFTNHLAKFLVQVNFVSCWELGSKNCPLSLSLHRCLYSLHLSMGSSYFIVSRKWLVFHFRSFCILTWLGCCSHFFSVAASAWQFNKVTHPAFISMVQMWKMFNAISQTQ